MSGGPQRLREDKAFIWETGCDLSDEALVIPEWDASHLRADVLDKLRLEEAGLGQPPVRARMPGRPFRRWAVGVGWLVTMSAAAFWALPEWGVQSEPTVEVVAPVTLPEASPVQPVAAQLDVDVTDELTLPAASQAAPVSRAHAVVSTVPVVPPVPVADPVVVSEASPLVEEAVAPALAADALGSAEPVTTDDAESRAGTELRAMGEVEDMLHQHSFASARDAASDYLDAFPDGSFRREAQFSLLRAHHGLGDVAATEALAARMLVRDEGLAQARIEEIRWYQATSLVELGDCASAVDVARDLPRSQRSEIKRSCRDR